MLVASGKDMQLGQKYSFSMLDSLVKVLIGPDQRWRGVYNTIDTYEPNDVVLVVEGKNAFLKYALVTTSGAYESGNWEDVTINIPDGTSGVAYSKEIVLSAENWEAFEGVGDYAYKQVIEDENITENLSPDLTIHLDSLKNAEPLSAVCETGEGTLTVYATSVPVGDITATLKCVGTTGDAISTSLPIATATQLGCIRLGKYLEGQPNGTVNVNITDIDDDVYDRELNRSVATDADADSVINGIIGTSS